MWVYFVLFVDEFGCASAPFLWCVVVLGHELEKREDYIVGRFGGVFKDLIGNNAWSRGFPSRYLVACGSVVAPYEVVV